MKTNLMNRLVGLLGGYREGECRLEIRYTSRETRTALVRYGWKGNTYSRTGLRRGPNLDWRFDRPMVEAEAAKWAARRGYRITGQWTVPGSGTTVGIAQVPVSRSRFA